MVYKTPLGILEFSFFKKSLKKIVTILRKLLKITWKEEEEKPYLIVKFY